MGWGHFTHSATKKVRHGAEKATGLKNGDLLAIAAAPFTAGASLAATSAAKNMIKNPISTIEGGLAGFKTAGPLGAFLGAVEGGGGFDEYTGNNSARATTSAADAAIAQQYNYQLALQHDAQNWQEGMSNTAHQREVADLKAAGLNPVLSTGGTGASTGSVGAGSVGMPDKVAEKIAEMQNKIAKMTLANELENSATQRKLNEAETAKAIGSLLNETNLTNAQVRNLDAATSKTTTTTTKDKITSKLYETPYLRNILAFGNEFFGGNTGGAAVTATSAHQVANAMSKPTTTVTNTYNSKGKMTGSKTTTSRKHK